MILEYFEAQNNDFLRVAEDEKKNDFFKTFLVRA
jgi:hypothetical protein